MIQPLDKEIARFLGYRGIDPDEQVQRQIDAVKGEILSSCHPRIITREEALTFTDREIFLGPIRTESRDLRKNLTGCRRVILLGATLGAEVDYLIRRYEKIDIGKAAIAQAVSAAVIEAFLDEEQQKMAERYGKEGWSLRPRYSPGFGDLPLCLQPEFLSLLQMTKILGVTLTDGLLMIPSKSVTAVIGLYRTAEQI